MSMSPEYEAVWLPALLNVWAVLHPEQGFPRPLLDWLRENTHEKSNPRSLDVSDLRKISGKFIDLDGNLTDEDPTLGRPALIAGGPWPGSVGTRMGRCAACGGLLALGPTSLGLLEAGGRSVCPPCFQILMGVEGLIANAARKGRVKL